MKLNEQQKAVVENRGGQLLVAAAAGSGKTSVLVERLLQRIDGDEGANITDFVVITFTKEAARELKQRISQELSSRLALNPQNRQLRRQINLIYQAQICTIHSFCSKLIRDYGHLIKVSPSFVQCSEGDAWLLKQATVDKILDLSYENAEKTGDHGFISLVNTLATGNDDENLSKILLEIHSNVQSHANPKQWLESQRKMWTNLQDMKLEKTEWGKLILHFLKKQTKQAIKELGYLLELCQEDEFVKENYESSTKEAKEQFESFFLLLDLAILEEKTWDDVLNAKEMMKFTAAGTKNAKKIDVELKELIKKRRVKAYDRVRKFKFGSQNQVEIENLVTIQIAVLTLLDLVLDFSQRYQLEKEQRNWVDYNDLEHFVVKLLVNEDGTPTKLAKTLDSQLKEVMVDEYQDTNQVQNAIFNSITSNGDKLFMVGDMKQAIYRFRLADPTIFTGKFQSFHPETAENPAEVGESRCLTLSENFRSRKEVLDTCNDFFSDVMTYEFGEVDYRRDGMLVPGADFPENTPGYYDTELNLLDLQGYFEDTKNPVDRYFAEARWVADKILTMVVEKFQVSTKDLQSLRNVEYSDFMLLLRSKNALAPYYILAFAEKNIPLYLKEGANIFESSEVQVAISLLKILDNPRQDVALLSVLRSPLFGFRPDDLALLRGKRFGCFYDALVAATLEETCNKDVEAAMALAIEKRDKFILFLEKRRREVGEFTPKNLLWSLYQETNMLGIYGNIEPGNERQNNLLEFHQLIGNLERGGTASLFSCLYQLDLLERENKLPKSPNNQREDESVVMHTIHSSKGLEKPVVIIAALSNEFNFMDLHRSVLFHPKYGIGTKGYDRKEQNNYSTLPREAIKRKIKDETISEELRLLYVAMTRAKEKLILSTVLPKGKKTVEKLFKSPIKPLDSTVLLEKKSFSEVILTYFLTRLEEGLSLFRWVDSSSTGAESMDPNFAPSSASRWILNIHDYRDFDQVSLVESPELQEKKVETPDFTALKEECMAWFDWEYPYSAAVETPSKLTATQTKGRNWLEEETEEEETKNQPPRKPAFAVKNKKMTAAQRGSAIHLLMEYLEISPDLDCSLHNITQLKEELLQQRKVTQAQFEVISAEQIIAFLESPWGIGARTSSHCQQEFKFSLLVKGSDLGYNTQEKMLLQGVVDCWYEDNQGNIVLIDFKSDQIKDSELDSQAKEHEGQMRTYSSALERITGKVVKEKLLWFFHINQGVLVK